MARYLALDWDQGQLHLVAATLSGTKVTIQRAAIWQEAQSPSLAEAEPLGKLLRERMRAAGFPTGPVLACLGRDRVILKELKVPAGAAEEEAGLVRFQAVKELSDTPEEVVIDYVPVGEAAGGGRRVLALVARREVVEAHVRLCQAAGLKLAGLTPRAFGLAACLRQAFAAPALTPPPEPADAAAAVVCVSETWAELCVVQGGNVLLARPLLLGPGLAGEVRRSLTLYAGQAPGNPVRAVYLALGAAGELRQRLADMIDLPIHGFDPFAGLDGLHLPPPPRGAFAGAVGLLHARAQGSLPINFIEPRKPRPRRNTTRLRVLLALAAGMLLIIGGGVVGRVLHGQREKELRVLEQERAELDRRLAEARARGKRMSGLADWDNPVWLDEVYDLTHRIPDVNALEIQSLTLEPVQRSGKSTHSARLILKGSLRGGSRLPLDQLIAEFSKDGFYSPQAPQVVGNRFTLVVLLEKRSPESYQRELEPVS